MAEDGLYRVVDTKIDDAVAATGDFYGHVETYDQLRRQDDTDPGVVQRSAEKVIDTWLAAEQERRDVDWLVHEISPEFTVRVEDEETGEEHVETLAADTVSQVLHHSQADLTNITDVNPPSRYSEKQISRMLGAVEDRYDDLANMNRQYLEALHTLLDYGPVAEDKFDRTAFGQTPVDREYAQIEDVMRRRFDEASA